ncbi:MAG TPA: hypothetical protein DEB40_01975 [Elusimicrobia bacterium]|nr:hypothetical protein [Elusimicrobiota bacterium]HBT60498.1 hypothetical protein [Elusimicrobiota bacterium]
MTQQVKRIDPFWLTHPMIPTAVAIGLIIGLMGYAKDMPILAVAGGAIAALAILALTRPVVSAVLGTLGLLGGLVSFVVVPNLSAAGMSIGLKLVATLMFAVFYMVLMDALILGLCGLYNLFSHTLGLSAVRVELEAAEDAAAE